MCIAINTSDEKTSEFDINRGGMYDKSMTFIYLFFNRCRIELRIDAPSKKFNDSERKIPIFYD